MEFDGEKIKKANPWLSDLQIFGEAASTQKLAKKVATDKTLFLTGKQTATYGRFGREYFADEGGIYFSLSYLGETLLENPVQYTIMSAAAVVLAIEKLTSKRVQIKWVNDIYLGDKKIVGILTELVTTESLERQIVMGMGINFSISDFPSNLTGKATSLFPNLESAETTPSELVAEILSELNRLSYNEALELYKAKSLVLGKKVKFDQGNGEQEGLAADILETGQLLVQTVDGEVVLHSGEISLTNWA